MNQHHGPPATATVFDVQTHTACRRGHGAARISRRPWRSCCSSAQGAGNSPNRCPDDHPHRASHHDTNDSACGGTGDQATSHQHRPGLALRFLWCEQNLRRRIRILRRDAVAGNSLLDKVFVNRCGLGHRGGQ